MDMDPRNAMTIEIPAISDAELLAQATRHLADPRDGRCWEVRCDLNETQEIPFVSEAV